MVYACARASEAPPSVTDLSSKRFGQDTPYSSFNPGPNDPSPTENFHSPILKPVIPTLAGVSFVCATDFGLHPPQLAN